MHVVLLALVLAPGARGVGLGAAALAPHRRLKGHGRNCRSSADEFREACCCAQAPDQTAISSQWVTSFIKTYNELLKAAQNALKWCAGSPKGPQSRLTETIRGLKTTNGDQQITKLIANKQNIRKVPMHRHRAVSQ